MRSAGSPGTYRIVHITTAHRATDNRIMRKECLALARAGFDVTLLAVADENTVVDGVAIHALPRHSGRVARILLGPLDVWRVLRVLKPDLIHVHDPELIPLAAVWNVPGHRRAVYDAHEDLPLQIHGKHYIPRRLRGLVSRLARLLEVLADRRMSGIVAATPRIAKNFKNDHVATVQNFPWLHDFPTPKGPDARAAMTLGYVGGVAPERGLAEMLQVVNSAQPAPQLLIAGPVSAAAQDMLDANTGELVEYLGVLPASEIAGVLARTGVGLVTLHPVPNYLESQPTKLFEYMAAARPFIASDFPSWRELLDGIDCGVFVDPFDSDAYRRAVEAMLADPSAAAAMGRRGREALEGGRFTFEKEADQLVAMTRELLDDGRHN